jgi:D-alanine--poly(phosphoribitol) ligase subunit 1
MHRKSPFGGFQLKNILTCIERTAAQYPNRIALADDQTSLSYQALLDRAGRVGSRLAALGFRKAPVAVYMNKTPDCAAAFLGVAYSGNFYAVLDTQMPADRVDRIFETLQPAAVITDRAHWEQAQTFSFSGTFIEYEAATRTPCQEDVLRAIRAEMTERDPLYVLYTSGSTGRPKGTLVSHRAVIAYTDWAIRTFGFNYDTVFGSQAPFYFSMSVTDLYSALRTGARLQIIPRKLFSFPLPLMEYLNQYAVNTLYWVPSALCIVANWDTFSYAKPESLQKVLFAGEVMPVKQLNYWRRHFPDCYFANLFGPTETTDICTYYAVERDFADADSLPIGRPCDNCRALILNEAGQAADSGELYIGGPFLADGYYRDPEKTAAAFVQNPLNSAYRETLYRTGDLVCRSKDGELSYLGRRDNQIKHMGYRIELGEIEANAGAADGVSACACVYEQGRDRLVLFYQGKAKEEPLLKALQEKLPAYMLPNRLVRLKAMPYNGNGKIDRKSLKNQLSEL